MTPHPAYGVLRPVTPYAAVLLADNPSPMTLDGTNTWLLRAPGAGDTVVVDPGPDHRTHLAAIAAAGPVREILLTHGHPDHSEGARGLHELTGAPVRALDPAYRYGADGLAEGDVVAAGGVEVRVVATPGHTADSLCFVVGDAVLTGDTILGRGSTVVAHPDGRLADYLASLDRLAALGAELGPLAVLPGHGPDLPDLAPVVAAYRAHREQRLDQIRDALSTLGADATPRAVVELVYADVDQDLWWAAELSVRAQLDHLRGR
jgi:glyoxylase-like metal-dependent hydrolase (beta-lactamase superfamily II)